VEGEAGEEAGEPSAELTYEAIAPVYDLYTAHHDYELWLGNLLPELKRHGLEGNLCRCTGYQNIVGAVQYASRKMKGQAATGD